MSPFAPDHPPVYDDKGLYLGALLRYETAPGGETIAVVKFGPARHQVRHYDASTIEVRRDEGTGPWPLRWDR